jgi:hypothetical protein
MKWPFAWQMKIDWVSSDNRPTLKVRKEEINDEQK